MTVLKNSSNYGFSAVETMIDALLKSDTATEFCRAIVHSELTNSAIQGCHMFTLDNSSLLEKVAGYGLPLADLPEEITAWDDLPIAMAIRSKQFVFENSTSAQPELALPLLRDGVPIGCLSLVLTADVSDLPLDERLMPILAKLGAYSLANMALPLVRGVSREPNGDELTARQVQILSLMAEGMVNAEIAAKLMVSESTVRQETVRIYRALGVPNRLEAAKRGRALGLIKRPPPAMI
jgi:DNA-binding CsgD family transcriptional regulator